MDAWNYKFNPIVDMHAVHATYEIRVTKFKTSSTIFSINATVGKNVGWLCISLSLLFDMESHMPAISIMVIIGAINIVTSLNQMSTNETIPIAIDATALPFPGGSLVFELFWLILLPARVFLCFV